MVHLLQDNPPKDKKIDVSNFSGVLIIRMEKSEPVIIIKSYACPLFREEKEEVTYGRNILKRNTIGKRSVIYWDYNVFWKRKQFGHKLPKEIKKRYGNYFWEVLNNSERDYNILELPEGVTELPMEYLVETKKFKIIGSKIITTVRDTLRQYKIISENRRRGSKKDPIRKELEEYIKEKFKGFKKKDRLPMKKIQMCWENKLKELLPDDMLSDKYYVSDDTIRRILRGRKKK